MRLAALAALALLLTGCGADQGAATISVFAASSLQAPFTVLGAAYERDHPGTTVVVTYAGSSDLVAQMDQGAQADVLATADATTMGRAETLLMVSGTPFARNTMAIAVPPDNPAAIEAVSDLTDPGLRTVLCAPQVPCGTATRRVMQTAGIDIPAVSEEMSVTDVVGKVRSGEADAGIVYVSDIQAAGDAVMGIPIPAAENTTNDYFIAAAGEQGRGFVDLVLSPEGQSALADAGFATP